MSLDDKLKRDYDKWLYFTESAITHAVKRYAESACKPSKKAIENYKSGLLRAILRQKHAPSAHTKTQ